MNFTELIEFYQVLLDKYPAIFHSLMEEEEELKYNIDCRTDSELQKINEYMYLNKCDIDTAFGKYERNFLCDKEEFKAIALKEFKNEYLNNTDYNDEVIMNCLDLNAVMEHIIDENGYVAGEKFIWK